MIKMCTKLILVFHNKCASTLLIILWLELNGKKTVVGSQTRIQSVMFMGTRSSSWYAEVSCKQNKKKGEYLKNVLIVI